MKPTGLLIPLLAWALLPALGCNRVVNSLIQPDKRAEINEKGRASCLQAANQNAPGASPAVEKQIVAYCDCFTNKGLSQFSNTELVELGMDKSKMNDPVIKAKMDNAVNTCKAEAFH